jgi:hypothetical protein
MTFLSDLENATNHFLHGGTAYRATPGHTTGGSKYDHGLTYNPDDAHPRKMSDGNLAELVVGAGWVHDSAQAVCIIKHESSGQTDSTSHNPDGNQNIGLFQIDTVNVTCGSCLKSPQYNAAVARRMWQADGGSFSKRWATAPQCASVTGNTPIGDEATNPVDTATNAVGSAASAITGLPGALVGILNGLPFFRLGKGLFGFMLLVGGAFAIIFIIANKASSSPAGKGVKKVAEVAALA